MRPESRVSDGGSSRFTFGVLALVAFAAIFDTALTSPILSIYAKELGASTAAAGFIVGLYSIVAIPASVVAGLLVDRLGRKRMLALGLLLDSIAIFSYGLVSSYQQLMLLRALHAVGGSLAFPAFVAKAREVSGPRVGLNLGFLLAPISLAYAVGSGAGGAIARSYGYAAAFALPALVLFLAFLLTLRLPERGQESRWQGFRGLLQNIRDGGPNLLAGIWLIFTLYLAIGMLAGGLGTSLLTGKVVEEEREARFFAGISLAIATLLSAPLMIAIGYLSDRTRPVTAAALSALISLVGLLVVVTLLGISASTVLLAMVVFSFALGGLIVTSTVLVTEVPPSARGTAAGLQQVFNIAGVAVGAPLGGLLASSGPSIVMLGVASALLLSLLVLLKR
ncbi:MAG: MFS transporter [Acidilobaceae archaeon]|nr:MFS transporter [Acidilobaceae archaeon]MCX8166197.1 MFS transporter [Acidilobaceae archaeon]MDW7974835.1 MFS transporter [Sulfolobales archaeon]